MQPAMPRRRALAQSVKNRGSSCNSHILKPGLQPWSEIVKHKEIDGDTLIRHILYKDDAGIVEFVNTVRYHDCLQYILMKFKQLHCES